MAGEGGAEGSILGVCGGVLPLDKLLVLPEDAFLRGLLLETCLQSPVGQERPMAHFPSHTSRANAMVS